MTSEPFLWLMGAQNRHLCEMSEKLDTTNSLLERIIALLEQNCQPSPEPPQAIAVRPTGEHIGDGTMSDKIIYDVNLPSLATPSDVVTRELTIIIGDGSDVVVADKADTVISGLQAPQDASVHLELVDIDDSGNRSEPATFDFVANDDFAPPKPGDFGVVVVGEEIPSPCPPCCET
jgi:hypothetical protein